MNGEYLSTGSWQQRCLVDLFQPGHVVKICAPMVRYSKLAFRSLVRKYDCELCFTPMIIASAFLRSGKARDNEFTTNYVDRPLVVQFAANHAQDLADAACIVSPFADGVDLNCGCPQRWAMAEGYGACLINKPELVQDMVRQVKNQVECPNFSVSIKIRIHKDLARTVDLCRKVEAAGISWITVHGRATEERHQPVHYDTIKIIKENLNIPVVANGDVRSNKDIDFVHQLTGIDGVMAARGLLANPAMFAGYEETPLQCVRDWVDIALEYGTPYTCFHHHLMYMLERITSKQEKKIFNVLSSMSAVIDYLNDNYGLRMRMIVLRDEAEFTPFTARWVCARRRSAVRSERCRFLRHCWKRFQKVSSSTMTLQWVAVASFLYAEIGFVLFLCLPFISPRRWLKIFNFRLWEKIASYWNRAFLTIIIVLVVLFFDAIREVRKYSVNNGIGKNEKLLPNMYDHLNMKLFRAQRNLYISGFSLFLWLVLRRMITLISELATAMGENQALKVQTDNTNDAAKRYMVENEELKKALRRGKDDGNKKLEEENEQLIKEIERLKAELKKTTEALEKSKIEMNSIKKQSDGLTREYDRLLQEHEKTQGLVDTHDKKEE
ncbi:tRNA-dihydrouridine(20a/20b) synthase [NAD(P)+]-like [Carcharodon carcharias]|uniref:tRNA-dihydrouridine(20a/20b) synthase [NAD(P)+]-like n=1 Tax=Carcharodon carcharias TaxID=13397 RepID=UPI001B7EDFFA|nr:tRNA-dihydrouridine(20a/20b) synthase [NAD(P)+]-like [Carcharodon carcharias]